MRALLLSVAVAALPCPVLAWGQTGHRVAAAIGDRYLTPSARAGVAATLGVEDLAEASNWPDFQRSDPARFWQDDADPFHYVTVPPGKTYAEAGAPKSGDAVTALRRFAATVRDPRVTPAERQLALRFIVHIVADLHQPLHAGNGRDRGGNDVKLQFFGQPTNLHAIWDSGIIDREDLSFSEKTEWLGRRITPEQLRAWDVADPLVWIGESTVLRDRIYPPAGTERLGYEYIWQWQSAIDQRLAQAGVRTAAYLNWLFAPDAPSAPRRSRRAKRAAQPPEQVRAKPPTAAPAGPPAVAPPPPGA